MKKNWFIPFTFCVLLSLFVSCSSSNKNAEQESESSEMYDPPIDEQSDEQALSEDEDVQDTPAKNPLATLMGDENDWIAIKTYEDEWPVYVNKNITIQDGVCSEILYDMSLNRRHSASSRFLDDETARGYIKRHQGLRQTPYYCIQKRRQTYWDHFILEYCRYYDEDGELIKENTGGVFDITSDYEESIRDIVKELAEPLLN